MRRACTLLVFVLLASSCGDEGNTTASTVDSNVSIQIPFAVSGLAWVDEGTVLTTRRAPSGSSIGTELVTVDMGTGAVDAVALPALEGCSKTSYEQPLRMDAGRFIVIRHCDSAAMDGSWTSDLVAVDIMSSDVEVIAPAKPARPTAVAWSASASRGLIASAVGDCRTIASVDSNGVLMMEAISVVDHGDLPMDDIDNDTNCSGAMVDWPAWSPHGNTAAFVASPNAAGREGYDRREQPWNLYLLDVDSIEARLVAADIGNNPGSTAWSTTDRIAFSSDDGVFVVPSAGGPPVQVDTSRAEWVTWSPVGATIVVLNTNYSGESAGSSDITFLRPDPR